MEHYFGAYQFKIDEENPEKNFEKIQHLLQRDLQRFDLILFPELFTTGFQYRDLEKNQEINEQTINILQQKAKEEQITFCGSIMEKIGPNWYNSLYCWTPEQVSICLYQKIHLFFYLGEKEQFTAGQHAKTLEYHGMHVAGAICFDLRFSDLFSHYSRQGTEVFFLPAQWPTKRIHHWQTLAKARAIENQAIVVACNATGGSLGGRSMIIDAKGEVLAQAAEQEELIEAEISLTELRNWRKNFPVLEHRLHYKNYFRDEMYVTKENK